MKIFKNLILILLLSFTILPMVTQASTISLSPASVVVHEGETFNISVNVNAPTTREYTVKMDMSFTTGIMRISTWNFGNEWTVLRQPGYDSFDNTTGILIRTGGYPAGFTGPTRFGVATFVAGRPGKGTISLTNGSFVFNEASQNTYTGANVVNVEVLPATKKEPAPVVPPPVVKRNFDIALVLDKPAWRSGETITGLLHLTNLSKVTALEVPIRYKVLDASGAVMLDGDYEPVSLEGVNARTEFKIDMVDLPPDMYSVVAEVAYDNLEKPAISIGHFRIDDEPVVELVKPKYSNLTTLFSLIALLIGLIIGALIARYKHLHRQEFVIVEPVKKTKTRKK